MQRRSGGCYFVDIEHPSMYGSKIREIGEYHLHQHGFYSYISKNHGTISK